MCQGYHANKKKNNGDKLSPWNTPLLVSTLYPDAKYSPHDISCVPVLHWFSNKLNNTFTELHQFKTFQNPKNRDSYHKLPFNQSMLFLGYCFFLQSLSTILSNYLTLGCFSFTLYVQLEACPYTLLDIIPVISFHMRGKHEIGWQLPTALLWP